MNVVYTISEIIVASMAIVGNTLVIVAFRRERRLRRRTNYYIVSLAIADLLVGLLGIPCALLASVGLPTKLYPCLFTLSLLIVLCTISIFSLVAVSVDRYWAILYPMGYSRNVRTKTAICIICACWVAGTIVGFLPLVGWSRGMPPESKCLFTKVMDYNFLVFLYLATIVFPALLMGAFYAHIYSIVRKQLKQIVTVNGMGGGSMLRVLGAARKRDVKAIKNLSIIVLFFIICWFPLYTINFVQAFCLACEVPPLAMDSCIILSHLNSAGNPLLYAYHLTDFRSALRSLLFGTPPDQKQCQQSLTQTRHRHGPGCDSRAPTPIVYKVPNTTPRMPHKIFDFDTTVAKNCSGNGAEMCISAVAAAAAVVASTERESDEALCRYTALLASTPRWGSLDSSTDWPNEHQRSYHYHAHSSPPSPTKPHVILDPT